MTTLNVSLSDIPETVLVPAKYLSGGSVGAQIAYGKTTSLMIATRQPRYHSKPHQHDAEQLNYVLEGELLVFVGDTGFCGEKGRSVPNSAQCDPLVLGARQWVLRPVGSAFAASRRRSRCDRYRCCPHECCRARGRRCCRFAMADGF